jgi:serine protease Do
MKRWSLACACLALGGLGGAFVATSSLHGKADPGPAPLNVPKEMTSYRDVVKKVVPAVVSIESRVAAKPVRNKARRPAVDDQRLPEEFRRFFQDMQRNMPEDADEGPGTLGFGSGFIIDSKGVVLTNHHVVDGADSVEVTLRDGRKFISRDIKSDPKTDLAIVRIDAKGAALPYLELGNSDAMEVGDRVLAVGAPFGLTGSVTAGIVSAKGRSSQRINMYEDFLQTDAAINPGNSGGPLVNLEGKVVGINSAIKSRSGGFQGVGLAVASNLADGIVKQLMRDGAVHRGYLGVGIQDVENADLAKRLGLKEASGVVITQVFDDAPAVKAGIQEGDVLVSLNGKTIKDGRELQTVVAGLPLKKPVDVVVMRDGREKQLHVTIEEQPAQYGSTRTIPTQQRRRAAGEEDEPETFKVPKIGLEAVDLTPEAATKFGYKEGLKGALVTRAPRSGVAGEAGVAAGMVVTKVDDTAVTSAKALRDAVASASLDKGVVLKVHTPQGTNYVLLKAEAAAK